MYTDFLAYLRRPLSRIDQGISFLIGYGILFMAYSDSVNRQWDFPVYYLAAHAIWNGQSPYDPAVLQAIADSQEETGYGGGLPYLYPPHLARMLYPFVKIKFFTASFLWMAFKCLALELILFFSFLLLRIPFTPLAWILGHLTTLYFKPVTLDFSAGNIATFESALILGGLAAWMHNRYGIAGILTILCGSFKGTSSLFILYPLHLRDTRYLFTLVLSAVGIGCLLLMDWHNVLSFFSFYQSPTWQLIWDEQVQSYYNCSSATVILRTFSDTYFAEPLIRCPTLAKILIPAFPIFIFAILAWVIKSNEQRDGFEKNNGIILSMILCGLLLLPPRLAGYTLIWTLFPMMQIAYTAWTRKSIIVLLLFIAGLILLQLNLPPNHIPPGITQLLIDKDFFGLLFFFICSVILCLPSSNAIDSDSFVPKSVACTESAIF